MKITALPELILLFKDSKSTSTQNGSSHFLIKTLRNKKWGNHHKNQRERLADAVKEVESLNINIAEMEDKLEKIQQIEEEINKHKEKLANL